MRDGDLVPYVRSVAQAVIADCEADAKALDGMPLTGRTVGERFGETLAMISALAVQVDLLAQLLERMHEAQR